MSDDWYEIIFEKWEKGKKNYYRKILGGSACPHCYGEISKINSSSFDNFPGYPGPLGPKGSGYPFIGMETSIE